MGRVIVQCEEVADSFKLIGDQPVVLLDGVLVAVACREKGQELRDATLDGVDAGGLQRFQESARQPDRDDILAPRLATPAGLKPDEARRSQRRPLEVPEQHARRFVLADIFTAINVTVSGSVLERNAPLPA